MPDLIPNIRADFLSAQNLSTFDPIYQFRDDFLQHSL